MFRFWAIIVTIGIIFNIVVIEMTIIICVARDVTRDDLVEIGVAAAEVRRRRGLLWNSLSAPYLISLILSTMPLSSY